MDSLIIIHVVKWSCVVNFTPWPLNHGSN